MQNFINTFSDLCEFYFIDGPHSVKNMEPIPYFVERGIKPPFRFWCDFSFTPQTAYKMRSDGSMELVVNKT